MLFMIFFCFYTFMPLMPPPPPLFFLFLHNNIFKDNLIIYLGNKICVHCLLNLVFLTTNTIELCYMQQFSIHCKQYMPQT